MSHPTPSAIGHVSSKHVLDGSLLESLAGEHLDNMKDLPSGNVTDTGLASGHVPEVELTWGSICSGSEVVIFVFMAIRAAYAQLGINIIFKHMFSCEINAQKQSWIEGIFSELLLTSGCLFERAEHMGQEFAKCVRHNCLCRVPRVNLLFAGTSCKDFSKANPNKNKVQVLGKASSPGGSAQTLNGLLAYLSKQVLDLLIFENVDTLDEVSEHQNETSGGKEQTPLQGICSAFHAAGLRVLRVLTDAVLFGMPQHRRRYYLVAVKPFSTLFDVGLWPCEYAFKRCRELLGLCVKVPPCLTEVMLGPDHSCLETALNYVLKDTYSVVSNNLKAFYMFFPSLNPTTTFP